MTDKKTIAEIVAFIGATYPNFSPSEATVGAYYQTLRDIPEAELRAATADCVVEAGRKFAPSVGEIRGKVSELRSMQQRIPTSYEAWQEVQDAPKTERIIDSFEELPDGRWMPIGHDFVWSHPLVRGAACLLGWPHFPGSVETLVADRARFIDCYEEQVSRSANDDMRLPEVRRYLETAKSLPDQAPKPLKGYLEGTAVKTPKRPSARASG